MSKRPIYARAMGKRAGRNRLTNGRVRITKSARKLNDQERREIEARLRAEGRL
jgi:hypothetical protein